MLHGSVLEWWSGNECCRELNVSSSSILANFSHHTVVETDFREATGRIAVSQVHVFVLASFFACPRDSVSSCRTSDTKTPSRAASGVLFPLPSCLLSHVDDQTFMKFFDDSSSHVAPALLACRRWQEVGWSELFCIGWLSYYFAKAAVEEDEIFTLLGRKRGTDGESLPLETLPEVYLNIIIGKLFPLS